MAQNAVKRLRTIRYPHILKFLDMAESNGALYVVVEHVKPLSDTMALWQQGKGRDSTTSAWIAWGLSHVASALAFFHQHMQAVHGNVHPGSVFLSPSGEWLLGGMETLSQPSESDALIMRLGGFPPRASAYAAPELTRAGYGAIAQLPIHAADSYSLSLLALEAYNGSVPSNISNFPAGRVPAPLYPLLKRMVEPRPDARLSAAEMLQIGNQPGGFLNTNVIVQANQIIEEFRVAHPVDKGNVLARLLSFQGQLAPSFTQFKVLPALVETFRYKGGSKEIDLEFSATSLLPLILRIGEKMDTPTWNRILREPVLGAMASPFQPIRAILMSDVALYAHHLDTKAVSQQLWPLVWKSFQSANDLQRTAAIENIRLLIPKFSERILNNELLRELAKMQKDVRPNLRLQATQLLSELSPHLSARTKADVLIPAFACSLRDTYDDTRLAGIQAFKDNSDNFDAPTAASHVLPALSPCLIDQNSSVRDAASRTLHFYLDKIAQYTQGMSSVSVDMPPLAVAEPEPRANSSTTSTGAETNSESRSKFASFLSATASNAASRLSEWAIAQIEEDDTLASQVTNALQEKVDTPMRSDTPETPGLLQSPAVPMHSPQGMSLSAKPLQPAEKMSVPILQPAPKPKRPLAKLTNPATKPREQLAPSKPVQDTADQVPELATQMTTSKPAPAAPKPASSQPAPKPAARPPPSAPSSTGAPLPAQSAGKALTKEEKLAQLNKVREERRAVRHIYLRSVLLNLSHSRMPKSICLASCPSTIDASIPMRVSMIESARVGPRFSNTIGLPATAMSRTRRNAECVATVVPTNKRASASCARRSHVSRSECRTFSPKNTTSGLTIPPHCGHAGYANVSYATPSSCTSPSGLRRKFKCGSRMRRLAHSSQSGFSCVNLSCSASRENTMPHPWSMSVAAYAWG